MANGNLASTGRYTGNAIATRCSAIPSQAQRLIGPPVSDLRSQQLAVFAQDEWRVTKQLSCYQGVLYEYMCGPWWNCTAAW